MNANCSTSVLLSSCHPFIMETCLKNTHKKVFTYIYFWYILFYNRTFQYANTDFKSSVDLQKPHADIVISCKHFCTTPAIVFLQNLRNCVFTMSANFLSCLPSRNCFTINFLTQPSNSLHFWQPCFFASSIWSYDSINSPMESSLKFHENFTEILILLSGHIIAFVHTFWGLCMCKFIYISLHALIWLLKISMEFLWNISDLKLVTGISLKFQWSYLCHCNFSEIPVKFSVSVKITKISVKFHWNSIDFFSRGGKMPNKQTSGRISRLKDLITQRA